MTRATRLLVASVVAAVAVPLLPAIVFGARIDAWCADWLAGGPAPARLAALEIGILAADIALPVPSSLVATVGGAVLGAPLGTLCAWCGLSIGSAGGWLLGRWAGSRVVGRLAAEERAALSRWQERFGPLAVLLSRPLPLVAEAAAILAGATEMRAAPYLAAAAVGNLLVAVVWSVAGALGSRHEALGTAAVWSLILPAALAWWSLRRARSR